MIERMIHPTDKGYRWFVYMQDTGHVLAQGYHRSAKIAENQMRSAHLMMVEEWGDEDVA